MSRLITSVAFYEMSVNTGIRVPGQFCIELRVHTLLVLCYFAEDMYMLVYINEAL